MNLKTGIVAATAIGLLAGCSGGSDEQSSDGLGPTSISADSYVDGTFVDLATNPSSVIAQHITTDYFSELGECENVSDRYYESQRVVVMGPDSLPDDDFAWAATLGEKSLTQALSAMDLTYSQYQELKSGVSLAAFYDISGIISGTVHYQDDPSYRLSDYQSILDTYFDGDTYQHSYGAEKVPTYSEIIRDANTNGQLVPRMVAVSLAALPKEQEVELYDALIAQYLASGGFDYNLAREVEAIDKMVVCLSANRSASNWGMGTKIGYEVAAKSASQRSDDLTIATHEAIHHLQITITSPAVGDIALERWFSEGQAVKLSGMKVNSGNHSRRTLDVRTFPDSEEIYGFANPNEYTDYGQAYNWFVSKFGAPAQYNILYAMRMSEQEQFDYEWNYASFVESFNQLPVTNCSYDCDFSLDEFRQDYPNQAK